MWAEKSSKRRFGAVVSNVLTLDGSKLFPQCTCFFNFYDVVDGFLLRCTSKICVVVYQQHVNIGWVKVASSVHLLL